MPVEGKPDRHPGGQPDGARSTGAALEAHYRFVLWLVSAVEHFPRSQKFLLGDRIQGAGLDVLERLIIFSKSSCNSNGQLVVDPKIWSG